MNYTEFLIDLGIKDVNMHSEYVALIKSSLRDIYETYGIVITKDQIDTTQTINTPFDTPVDIEHPYAFNLSISGYTEGSDYTFANNQITTLSTGTMLADTDYTVSYSYYEYINTFDELVIELYPEGLISNIPAYPVNSVYSVTYDGSALTLGVDYYIYNGKIQLAEALEDEKIPLILDIDAGYETVPYDLKQAFFEYVEYKFDYRDRKAHLISSVSVKDGGTTKYKDSYPKSCKRLFKRYSPFGLAFT